MTHVVDGGGRNVIKNWRELTRNNVFWRFLGKWEEVLWGVKGSGSAHCGYSSSRERGLYDRLTEEGHERFGIS